MSAQRKDLFIYQGDSFIERLELPNGVDLTGLLVAAQVRRLQDRSSELYAILGVEVHDPVSGPLDVLLTPEESALIPRSSYWDLQSMTPDGSQVKTIFSGIVTLVKQVTTERAPVRPGIFVITIAGEYVVASDDVRVEVDPFNE